MACCLIPFQTTAEATGFPFVEQAAQFTRCWDSQTHPAQKVDKEYLITSCKDQTLSPEEWLQSDRKYWGIETGLHLRLDVIAREDSSRVRNRRSALNLAMMRRTAVTIAVHWIRQCPNPRKATLSGFYDFMSAKQARKAVSLLTVWNSSALHIS